MEPKIFTLDTNYIGKPHFAAAYLVKKGDHGFLVDNGVNASIPTLINQITKIFGTRTDAEALSKIDALILTHIHLDHAGATSQLLKLCPNAKVIAHPRSRRHLEDPSKLMNAVAAVYGLAESKQLYGEILSVPSDRILDVNDNQEMSVGDMHLKFHHLRGHAKHHIGIFLPDLKVYFSGDSFGLTYPELFWTLADGINRQVVIPSTSPSDFEYEEAVKSIDRIERTLLSADPLHAGVFPQVYPTHFGPHSRISEIAEELRILLKIHEEIRLAVSQSDEIRSAAKDPNVFKQLVEQVKGKLVDMIQETWCKMFGYEIQDVQMKPILHELRFDIELNAQGLVVAAMPKTT